MTGPMKIRPETAIYELQTHPFAMADAYRDWLLASRYRNVAAYAAADPPPSGPVMSEDALLDLRLVAYGYKGGSNEARADFRAAALRFVREVNAATIEELPTHDGRITVRVGPNADQWAYTADLRRIFCGDDT